MQTLINAVKYFAPIDDSLHAGGAEETEAITCVPTWDRPAARDSGKDYAYSEEQLEARSQFAKALTAELTTEHLIALGAYVTPGNPNKDGAPSTSLMLALTLPMEGITFVNPAGETETTRPWNLNINATLLSPKVARGTPAEASALTFDFAALRTAQLKAKAKK